MDSNSDDDFVDDCDKLMSVMEELYEQYGLVSWILSTYQQDIIAIIRINLHVLYSVIYEYFIYSIFIHTNNNKLLFL